MKKLLFITIALLSVLSADAKNTASDTLFVTGVVRDAATGKALLGARVNAGSYTAITDENGHYNVRVPSRGITLSVTSFGFTTGQMPIQGKHTVDVSLYSSQFEEGKRAEHNYTNSPSITADEIIEQHLSSDVRSVNRSAQTGIGDVMFIRGYHSLSRNSQPLFVVDGTVWDNELNGMSAIQGYTYNPLQTIDLNDIESINVVKDATSLYGSKGANGVIVITTKRSNSISTKIGVDISYGFNFRPKLPDVMDASQYRNYMTEMMKGAGYTSTEMTTIEKTLLTEDPTSIYYNKYHNNHNWRDEVYQTGNTKHYGINVQGGDNVATYMISLAYTGSDQTVSNTDFSRLNTRINGDINLVNNVKLSSDIYFTHVTRNIFDDGVNARTSPTYVAGIKSPMLMGYKWKNDGSAMTNTYDGVDELNMANPNALVSNEKGINKQYRFGVSIAPQWQITPELTFTNRFSYTLDNAKEHYFSPRTGTPTYKLNGVTIYDAIVDQTISQNNIMNEAKLTLDKTFGSSHSLHVNLGWRLLANSYKSSIGTGYNTSTDDLTNLTGSLTSQSLTGLNDKWNSSNLFLSADYQYQQRYRLWAVMDMDGSSRFGHDATDGIHFLDGIYGFFPSAGCEWTVSNERFMNAVKGISLLRLHTSFGVTGNDDIPANANTSYLSAVNYIGNAYGLVLATTSNSKLRWETTRKLDFGIDLGLLDNRINIGFDLYHHVTDNMLSYHQADKVSGTTPYLVNDGKMINRGFETSLAVKLINKEHFKWNTEFTVNHFNNEVNSIANATTYNEGLEGYTTDVLGGHILTAVGHSAGVFYGYKSLGVFSSDAQARVAYNGNSYLKIKNEDTSVSCFKAGDIHFADLNNDGYIDEKDMTIIGNPTPDVTGAFSNHFSYKRFTLDVNFTYTLGGDIYNYNRQMMESMTDFSNQSTAIVNRWKIDGQITDIPHATYGDPMGNSRFSDRWIEDGSYLKLKQIRFTYTLPVTSSLLDAVTVWGAVTNVYTWTRYLGSDPETSIANGALYQGIDNGLLSNGRSFYMGIKLNL
jgi:TonB-linked SusC/RagA family outer membrane protein